MRHSADRPEPGQYIAFLTRVDGPSDERLSRPDKGRLRSEFLFDAIALEASEAEDIVAVAPVQRPLFRLKTTLRRFQHITGRNARPGEWFLLTVKPRYGGSWIWGAVEDPTAQTGYREGGRFSAERIEYISPDGRTSGQADTGIAGLLKQAQKKYFLAPSRLGGFRRLRKAISKASHLYVESIDVGQASFTCIHDGQNSFAYFDAGLPLWFNAKSMPQMVKYYPPYKQAIVVISHWDYDHYSAIQKYSTLRGLRYIAPAGALGPNAAKLAKELGARLRTPIHGTSITIGSMRLRWANGPLNDRNNRGIILVASFNQKKILLTGDASYEFIKSAHRTGLTGVVIPHHASDRSHSPAHTPTPVTPALAVVSAGHPNTYDHPGRATQVAHKTNGWNVRGTGAYPSNVSRGNQRF